MIIDFKQTDTPTEFLGDLCIIGAGAAGISIASEFSKSGFSVFLVESGSFDFDIDTQALYDVENAGIARHPMIIQRLRYFGGTTNHWDGRCAPLDPIDFAKRDWIPYSGWPINRSDLDSYYIRAHDVCDLKSTKQNEQVAATCKLPTLPTDTDKLVLHTWQNSPPTRFGAKYRNLLEQSKNISVILNANATNIESNDADTHVEHIDIASMNGRKGKVKARQFVIACGGIENARLLLASNKINKSGIGNTHDLVGRFFMEHLRTKFVAAQLQDNYVFRAILNECRTEQGEFISGIRLADTLQQRQRAGNAAVMAYTEGGEKSPTKSAYKIVKNFSQGHIPNNFGDLILNALSDIDSIIVNVRRHILIPGSQAIEKALLALVCESEQVPNPESQISLSHQKDALSQPIAKVNWRLSDEDLHTMQVFANTLANQLAAHFNARIRIPEWLSFPLSNWQENFRDVSHHMGTTRMSTDKTQGVVDRNCRMHTIDNLYIAGSSVFTTSGHVNPTLTIVCLALRLSDHLKAKLQET